MLSMSKWYILLNIAEQMFIMSSQLSLQYYIKSMRMQISILL